MDKSELVAPQYTRWPDTLEFAALLGKFYLLAYEMHDFRPALREYHEFIKDIGSLTRQHMAESHQLLRCRSSN